MAIEHSTFLSRFTLQIFQRALSSDDESDSSSEPSAANENGNANKKQKLHEKSKVKNKENNGKKPDLTKNKEKSVPVLSTTVEQAAKSVGNSKEVKTTTVKDFLRAQRDASLKRSNPTSSATSEDSSSSDSSTSDSSDSDGEHSRHSDDDDANGEVDHQNMENRHNAVELAAAVSINNKPATQQINGIAPAIDEIPAAADLKLLDDLNSSTRESIHRFVENVRDATETEPHKSLETLYEYVLCIRIVSNASAIIRHSYGF